MLICRLSKLGRGGYSRINGEPSPSGWSIGASTLGKGENRDHSLDAPSLYDKLEHTIVPLFYHDRRSFMDIMAYSIAINGSFFNTQRMLQEYVLNACFNR